MGTLSIKVKTNPLIGRYFIQDLCILDKRPFLRPTQFQQGDMEPRKVIPGIERIIYIWTKPPPVKARSETCNCKVLHKLLSTRGEPRKI